MVQTSSKGIEKSEKFSDEELQLGQKAA